LIEMRRNPAASGSFAPPSPALTEGPANLGRALGAVKRAAIDGLGVALAALTFAIGRII
jgi:hypothetical protein